MINYLKNLSRGVVHKGNLLTNRHIIANLT